MTDDTDKDASLFANVALDDASGPARRISSSAQDAMVASVLDGFFAVPTGGSDGGASGTGGSTPATTGAPSPATTGAMSKAAGLSTTGKLSLIVSGAVLLAVGAGVFVATQPRRVDSPRVATTATPPPARSAPRAAIAAESPPVPRLAAPEAAAPQAAPATPAQAAELAARVADRPPAASVAPSEPLDVAAMLERANAARRAGSYAEAARLYLAIVSAAPTSREAHVARVAAATIELDRLNDPRAAARLFRSEARGGSGALAAEAAFGLSRAARASGDRATEVQALELLVRAHGTSPYASVAERRLRELGVDPTPSVPPSDAPTP